MTAVPGDVLLIRQSAFGDILHLLPAVRALKEARPGMRVSLLVRERFRPMAARAPFVDEVWTRIERRVEAVVDCQGLMRTAWLALRSGAAIRAGLGWADVREKPAALLYNRRVGIGAAHVIDRQAELLSGALGLPVRVDRSYRASFLAGDVPAVTAFLAGSPAPRLLVHPTSAQAGKHLSLDEWLPFLRAAAGKGYAVILSHGPGEEGVAARWRAALPRARVAPVLPLEDLGALVAGCRLMLGADTGITHLADQLGVRVLSWYTLWPPERNGPYFSPGLVFYRRPPDMGEIAAWMESLGL